jgi:hypothetical protein
MAAAIAAAEAAANELLASETKGAKKSANKKR